MSTLKFIKDNNEVFTYISGGIFSYYVGMSISKLILLQFIFGALRVLPFDIYLFNFHKLFWYKYDRDQYDINKKDAYNVNESDISNTVSKKLKLSKPDPYVDYVLKGFVITMIGYYIGYLLGYKKIWPERN